MTKNANSAWLDKVFGENVKRRRKELGLTQEEFGKILGVTKPRVSELENARFSPTLYIVQRIASCLGVQAADLLRPGKGLRTQPLETTDE